MMKKDEVYMILYVDTAAHPCGRGDKKAPFRTITEAARIAKAGDEVIVAPGIYRERVDPAHSGTDDEHRIIYRSEIPLSAVITGAEPVKNWTVYQDTVWCAHIPNGIFGEYNPYGVFPVVYR
jgi:hypothetical protein